MSTKRIQNLVTTLLYRGDFELTGKFKDLPPELRHNIMLHYEADFIIMLDGVDSLRNHKKKLNDAIDIHIGSIDLEENNENCNITVNSDMLMVLGTSLNNTQGILQIGNTFSDVLRRFKVELLNKIRATNIPKPSFSRFGLVAAWQYPFTIPFKDFRYHFIVNLNSREPFTKKTIEDKLYFKEATLKIILRKITLIHENIHDITQDS